jgi:nitrate/nitrite-specific signal transduction histidine kinase
MTSGRRRATCDPQASHCARKRLGATARNTNDIVTRHDSLRDAGRALVQEQRSDQSVEYSFMVQSLQFCGWRQVDAMVTSQNKAFRIDRGEWLMVRRNAGGALVSCILMLTSLSTADGARAQGDAELRRDGAVKINWAGRQRMLSQRLAMTACLAHIGVDAPRQTERMLATRDLFASALEALQRGGSSEQLREETDQDVLAALNDVAGQWTLTFERVTALAGSPGSKKDLVDVLDRSLSLLLVSDNAVGHLEAKYSASGSLGADIANAINVAGRQRMLSQKMSKELCALAIGHQLDATRAQIVGTVALFDSSRERLAARIGRMGFSAEQLDDINRLQSEADATWQKLRPVFTGVAAGAQPGADEIATVAGAIEGFLVQLDRVVSAYQRHGPQAAAATAK